MKYLLFLLLPLSLYSQSVLPTTEHPRTKFVKVASIENNHTHDEWRAVPDSFKLPPDIIHDTIYLPQKQIDSIMYWRKVKYIDTARIQYENYFSKLYLVPKFRYSKKKHKKERYGYVPLIACPLDTIHGTILYNNGYHEGIMSDGNIQEEGYWIGRCANYLFINNKCFIPAVFKDIKLSMVNYQIKKTIIDVRKGSFRTADYKKIPYSHVYGIMLD